MAERKEDRMTARRQETKKVRETERKTGRNKRKKEKTRKEKTEKKKRKTKCAGKPIGSTLRGHAPASRRQLRARITEHASAPGGSNILEHWMPTSLWFV